MSRTVSPEFNVPQYRFLTMGKKFSAYVAGYGGGKTWVGCAKLAKHFLEFKGINAGYFAPTYPQIRDIFYPTVEEAVYPWGFKVKITESNKEVHVYQGRRFHGTIICRSMERPETIIGFKIGRALVDEVDVMKPEKAMIAWRKIIARMRYKVRGLQNAIDVTTTPEGFGFVYRQFVEQVREKPEVEGFYGLVQASTYDNKDNLPEDYIPSLLATYPAQLIDAYINGQFVNLKTGSVYVAYDRLLNACDDVIQPGETLFIGMDFNVGKMAAVTHVKRMGLPCAVDEIVNAYDTPDMIRRIKEKYWMYDGNKYVPTCAIRVYPDASGDSRKSVNASSTDIQLLKNAGFQVIVNHSNPPVKDRINSMNSMFCNALGHRRYRVNHHKCPTYTASLEQQAWADNGEPDKTTGHDHTNDAGGYFIQHDYPVVKRTVTTSNGW
jgi:hypothetical protein